MMQEPAVVDPEVAGASSAHFVHALMRFAVAVRHRKHVVAVTLLVTCLFGGLYYLTATRYYSAKAGLLVLQVGNDVWSPGGTQRNLEQTVLPTYENLISSTRVIEGAIRALPIEDRIDLAAIPQDKWVATIRENLNVRGLRGTNIIEVTYNSRDPRVAVSVVNAIVDSYVQFMDATYKSTAGEIIYVLQNERARLFQQLATKRQELLKAQQVLGDMGITPESRVTHPIVQRALSLNDELIKVDSQRMNQEAVLAALRAAVRDGVDLQQYVLTVINTVGEQMLLNGLGFSGNDAAVQSQLERDLVDYTAQLKTLQEHLGPAHPRVTALSDKIHITEQYLAGYRDRIQRRLGDMQNKQLGDLMIQMVQQRLAQSQCLESSLQAAFNAAQADAVALNGRMAQIEILQHDVQWLGNLHDALLSRIAGIDLKQDGLDVRTTRIDEPVLNPTPVSPKLPATILFCLMAGIGTGLLAIYLIDILDDRFRTIEEMQSVLGVPVLSMIQQLRPSDAVGVEELQIVAEPEAAESEAFRTLRTALSLSHQDSSRLVVSSPEPGDGKTTLMANLAAAFAQSQKKTLLIDADLRRPGLTAVLNMRGMDGLSGIIRGQDDIAAMAAECIRASGVEGLDVLPSGPRPTNPAELLASSRFAEFLAWAEGVYDQLLIDSPPALATSDTAQIGRLVDGVILVVQPAKNRRRTLMRTVETFQLLKIPVLGLAVNRMGSDSAYQYYGYGGYGYEYVADDDQSDDETIDTDMSDPAIALGSQLADEEAPRGIVPRRAA